jgi:hypothetical protein
MRRLIFRIKSTVSKKKADTFKQIQWTGSTVPFIRVRVELLTKQRIDNGNFFITLAGVKKIVPIPTVEFYCTNIYEALNRVNFREISDITISSSLTTYNGPQKEMPLLIDSINQ